MIKINVVDLVYWIVIAYVFLFVPGGWLWIGLGVFAVLVFDGAKKVLKSFKK
jgi:hypothetical protein